MIPDCACEASRSNSLAPPLFLGAVLSAIGLVLD
jgi:hypothetical protein